MVYLLLAICLITGWNSLANGSDFEKEIAPLLIRNCLECHSPVKTEGGLDLSSREGILRGGKSGTVIEIGNASGSYLWQRIQDGEMPPESKGRSRKLPLSERTSMERWIDSGASWPKGRALDIYERTNEVRAGLDWWALQPIKRPEVPTLSHDIDSGNSIDAFIGARHEELGFTFAPLADRRTLIRRVTIDLIGLPPSPKDVHTILNDSSPDWYAKLIDRLLNSEHYGERWARYWLDVVRFAETSGYERDQLKPNIWKYRDWVINAFNADMPYDRFLTDQLAGDEVSYRDEDSVIATGMIRAGTWNDEPNDPADYLYERLEDMVHTTSSAFLGLTVKCARCHDHKFDPIRQTDYYRMAAMFWSGYIGQGNLGGPDAKRLGYDVFGWTDKKATAEPIHLLIKGDRHRPGALIVPGFLSAVPNIDRPLVSPPPGSGTTHRRLQWAQWMTDSGNPLTARVMVNRLWLHHFGQGIVRTPNNFGFKSDPPTHPRLLDWLASEFMNPSQASVEGEGQSWKMKRMHRLIMMSRTYRQVSIHPQQEAIALNDSQNRYWWHCNRRRLDAEALRDSMLAVSGNLNPEMRGSSFYPRMSEEALEGLSRKSGDWKESEPDQRARRSIYLMTRRSRILPMMTAYDFADTTRPCGQRNISTVAPQALVMMNNPFVHHQSQSMARRIFREVGPAGQNRQIDRAWNLAFGRDPNEDELAMARDHLLKQADHFQKTVESRDGVSNGGSPLQAMASLCHVLLNANEFIYLD
ncbi:MAG TPA: DUF1553 domain-containing protein [Verrucomicrobiales bacterium]|nr:DUF1553 domain-containing protein [Verrucomicrobiales bacterium]HIL71363.1 DUF1553 domain-containing protein [Verrucomicrobiota bacterium]